TATRRTFRRPLPIPHHEAWCCPASSVGESGPFRYGRSGPDSSLTSALRLGFVRPQHSRPAFLTLRLRHPLVPHECPPPRVRQASALSTGLPHPPAPAPARPSRVPSASGSSGLGELGGLAGPEHLVDQAVLTSLLGREHLVALDVLADLLDRRVRVTRDRLLEPGPHPLDLFGVDLDVRRLRS